MNDERAIRIINELGRPTKAVVRKIDGEWWVITQRWLPRMFTAPNHGAAVAAAHALEVQLRRPKPPQRLKETR